MENKKKNPSKLLILFGFILAIVGCFLWSTFIAPTHFVLEEKTYIHTSIPQGFDGFKIAFISDFDLATTEDLDYLESCIKKINEANCDMVIFGGDLYETNNQFDSERLISILKTLDIRQGKLAVLGENEIKANTDACIQILEKSGFEVLRNDAHYIYSNNDRIVFAGLENNGDVDTLLSDEMKTHFILSTVHQPHYFDQIQNSTSLLQLSGHTGGGFIQIPFLGGIIKVDESQPYTNGTTQVNDHTLMINNGIGLGHSKKARFNCDSQALIITLRTSK